MFKIFLRHMKGYLWALGIIAYFAIFFYLGRNMLITNDVRTARISFLLWTWMAVLVSMVFGIIAAVRDIRRRWREAKKEYHSTMIKRISSSPRKH